jgi:leader peptidase (prepilin peptidase)/N-methyltransferase
MAHKANGMAQTDGGDLGPAAALTRTNFICFVATTALIWTACAWHWGAAHNGLTALSWAIFYAALLTLVVIDLRDYLLPDYLLPDAMTQPRIWIGLLAAGAGLHRVISTPVNDAVQGAVAGYVGLWAIAAAYALATGTEGMGRGDFKLLAMPGAWAVVAIGSSLLASPTKNKK